MFEQITVDPATGAISYPSPKGFTLDMDRVHASAATFAPPCSAEMAARHAIHDQLQAFVGGRYSWIAGRSAEVLVQS